MSQLPTENPKQKHSHYFKNVEVLTRQEAAGSWRARRGHGYQSGRARSD